MVANDLGDRDLEKRASQWTTGKMMDSFTPLGPALVTCDELPEPGRLSLHTLLNGKMVQQGNTADMYFDVPYLISYISSLTTLLPGDIILTGSPKMMGTVPAPSIALRPGDLIEVEIDGLGRLSNPVIEEE
jgi:acylpyruvate hydrolase